ncbi:MAG: hypothetical protein ACREHF_15760 [Rhizomicrobium sp.]
MLAIRKDLRLELELAWPGDRFVSCSDMAGLGDLGVRRFHAGADYFNSEANGKRASCVPPPR